MKFKKIIITVILLILFSVVGVSIYDICKNINFDMKFLAIMTPLIFLILFAFLMILNKNENNSLKE